MHMVFFTYGTRAVVFAGLTWADVVSVETA